ncbi:winged helix-turn-helix domain-containing protein [Stenotrophomonas maltophilia]|nr:winged helix-turn-helix domain-containing protein [uncultured Stenotrophomonas sp.]MBH1635036.1 winged helix-turn-helix domain-containing protein [Stenotrophomonas maltophilia]TIE19502.1 two-component system response regulator OmpR [Stenotrophomonas maltophilia]TIE63041.1 two-component system response regulator OmpR [Stenotrophomonas maltophilia]
MRELPAPSLDWETCVPAADAPAGRVLLLVARTELHMRSYLRNHGFSVQVVHERAHLERLLQRSAHDFVLIDSDEVGAEGLMICHRLRTHGHLVPILLLSTRGEATDRIMGLEMGADDILGKPFEPREVVARLRSLQRRQRMTLATALWSATGSTSFGPFVLNGATMELRRNEQPVMLTSTELQLLRIFLRHPGRPLGRDYLLESLKGAGADVADRSIDVQVSRLRRKLGEDTAAPRFLRTVWGIGYVFLPGV